MSPNQGREEAKCGAAHAFKASEEWTLPDALDFGGREKMEMDLSGFGCRRWRERERVNKLETGDVECRLKKEKTSGMKTKTCYDGRRGYGVWE